MCVIQQVRDLSAFNISYVPVTNEDMGRVKFIMNAINGVQRFRALSEAEKQALLVDKECPSEESAVPRARFMCIIHWTHTMVNLDLDLKILDKAMEDAIQRLERTRPARAASKWTSRGFLGH